MSPTSTSAAPGTRAFRRTAEARAHTRIVRQDVVTRLDSPSAGPAPAPAIHHKEQR